MRSSICARASALLRPDGEQRFEIVARVRLERDMRLRPRDSAHLSDASRHDVGELVVLSCPDHGHEVEVARDRVDLGDAFDRGERLAQLRQSALLRRYEHHGGYHLKALDVDVVECGLDVVRGFLKGHGPAPIERRLVRVERVLARLLVEYVELLFALIDRELDAVTRSRADQEVSSERNCLWA